MSVLIKNMEMPKGCIYANDNDQTEYCPLLNHDDVPFCQYIESEPECAIGIDERPVYCPLSSAQPEATGQFSTQDDKPVEYKTVSAQPEHPEPCELCSNLEKGDTLYQSSDWDGGVGFDYIRDIQYCPMCGRRLKG